MRLVGTLLLTIFPLGVFAAEPRTLVDGCHLELVAREPDIVTPIGIAFDHQGRLLVVESHTHQRTEDYTGPSGDRLRMFSDSDGDGRLDRWSTFAEGFRHAMNVAVRPDGGVYLITRGEVHLLHDTDDDGAVDKDKLLLRLETQDDYPHNALSGFALAGDRFYLGLGENHGFQYRLVGNDGQVIVDSGGAGMVFTCHADGSGLERYATGFWNPFSLCLAGGRLFCVDNDPDASPPCRLIDVVEAGDYGFRYEYGRAGVHPLQAWDGQLPGTLPMICGTGEAPTAVVFHRGYLWVTSWGDHRIERYQLSRKEDGSYGAELTVVVQGDGDFRPTGMDVAADGSLYFGDWVKRDYPVHGQGRIWRLQLPEDMQGRLPPKQSAADVGESRLRQLERMRWQRSMTGQKLVDLLRSALQSPAADVRLFAVRWIAEARVTELVTDLQGLLYGPPPSERYYLAVLAAIDWLSSEFEYQAGGIADDLLARELRNPRRSAAAHALALRLMSSGYKYLTLERLQEYLQSEYEPLRLETVRTLALREDDKRHLLLVDVVNDESQSDAIRAEALVGLSAAAVRYRSLFERFADSDNRVLKREARRVLRLIGQSVPVAREKLAAGDLAAWRLLLAEPGDADSGRRLFFSPVGPQCSVCHRHGGRGGSVGPDLTNLAQQSSRERTITSILDPSAEMAPRYQPWLLQTADGKTHVGLRLPKGGDDGQEPYSDTAGRTFILPSESIILRQPASTSIMPAGLEKSLTVADLRDLLTFLTAEP